MAKKSEYLEGSLTKHLVSRRVTIFTCGCDVCLDKRADARDEAQKEREASCLSKPHWSIR